MRGPEGRSPKRQPSPEGLRTNPDGLSAVGAALYLGPLAPFVIRRNRLAFGK
jgi:hypothetical protein